MRNAAVEMDAAPRRTARMPIRSVASTDIEGCSLVKARGREV
jgi:hypothetical protein